MTFAIRPLTAADAHALAELHKAVARVSRGLSRRPDEIDPDLMRRTMERAGDRGAAFGAFEGGRLIGHIHAMTKGAEIFAHVWTELTVAVHPDSQGKGVGRALFEALFEAARGRTPPVERIELFTSASNQGAQRLYESLGFRREGVFVGRIRHPDGSQDDDIAMAVILA